MNGQLRILCVSFRQLFRPVPAILIILLCLGAYLSGCDTTELDPFQNEGRYFSVYGYISDLEQNHAIRVVAVRRSPEQIQTPIDPQAELPGVVTTTDTLSGAVVNWTHRLSQLADGSYGHIYHASFNVIAGRTYRLDITRDDGKVVTAETTVPFLSSTRVQRLPPVEEEDSSITQDVILPGVYSPWDIRVVYYYSFGPAIRVPYGRVGEALEGEGWTFRIDYDQDQAYLDQQPELLEDGLEWDAMGVEVLVLDDQWTPPDDIFDPELLATPGSFSNVQNGYGYFGSIGLLQDSWPNSEALDAILGFQH